jgi:hemerythrin-like domain-containing protein
MNCIDELKSEHQDIKTALVVIKTISKQMLASSSSSLMRDAEELIDFFRTFVNTCHHGKEESGLFPVLDQIGISHQDAPIRILLDEHEKGGKFIHDMARALKDYKTGLSQAAARFSRHVNEYINLLKTHIQKENEVIFPTANLRLPESSKSQIKKQFEEIEEVILGPGKHKQYHTMLEVLNQKYAPIEENIYL